MILLQLANSGDEVLLFYNDNSFHTLVGLMKAEGPLSGISYTQHTTYSMYTVIRTPMGQKKVSFLVRCPHFRG